MRIHKAEMSIRDEGGSDMATVVHGKGLPGHLSTRETSRSSACSRLQGNQQNGNRDRVLDRLAGRRHC